MPYPSCTKSRARWRAAVSEGYTFGLALIVSVRSGCPSPKHRVTPAHVSNVADPGYNTSRPACLSSWVLSNEHLQCIGKIICRARLTVII
jgi:hypothetical protein